MSQGAPEPSWLRPDSEGMLAATLALGDQVEAALGARPVLEAIDGVRHVAVLGMGGSGVAGAVLAAVATERMAVPVVSVSGYLCPRFVDPSTIVFAVSFSGETEETLEATSAAAAKGARLVALSTGGSLAGLVAEAGGTVIEIPPGIPEPRAAVGSMVSSLLLACEQAGLMAGVREELALAVEQLRRRMPRLASGGGDAAEVARRIGRTIPLVHGASGLGAVAARRWKTQLNENAKAPAFFGEEPEVCHNEVCGFGQNGDVTRQLMTLVELRMPGEDERIGRRFSLVAEAIGEAIGDVVTVQAEGSCDLAAFFDLVAVGDVASLHLAAREGIDPGPVPVLQAIKQRLSAAGRSG